MVAYNVMYIYECVGKVYHQLSMAVLPSSHSVWCFEELALIST